MKSPVRRARGLAERPFLLFGLLLLLPALGFGLLGWHSVQRERQLQTREAASEAEDVLEARLRIEAADVRAIEARESERPYFTYQQQYAPEETAFQQLDFQPSPLTKPSDSERVLGFFQWELGSKGVFTSPEFFGPQAGAWADDFVDAYGAALRSRLEAAPTSVDVMTARRVDHALRVVAANEERGQLSEEMQIVQRRVGDGEDAPANPNAQQAATPYLENFYRRVSDAPVHVRYGAFHYLARAHDRAGPPMVAYRLVWIPASYADKREVSRDRWLLQGYALDPGAALPRAWTRVGTVRLRRRDQVDDALTTVPSVFVGSLADTLEAERMADADGVLWEDPSLALASIPDQGVLDQAYADARTRYLWLLLGVLSVVGVGFVVVTRGLRREIALARRKEDFLAAVTHELKTPLAGIRMHADMLKQGWVPDSEAHERYADRIIGETDRLGHLVDQILDLAALERGVAKAHAVPGDLGACVSETVASMRSRATQAEVALEVDVEDDLPLVVYDPRLVCPLLLNLLDNAIKYSEHADTKSVRVSLGRVSQGIALRVTDRGVGIDPSIRRHLFEPFRRAGDEHTRTAPGIGIGLALVKRYADAHAARVAVDSEPGQGTTVEVIFPAPTAASGSP